MNIALIVIGLLLLLAGSLGVTASVIILIVKAVQKKPVNKTLKWIGITVASTVIGVIVMTTGIVKDENNNAETASSTGSYEDGYEEEDYNPTETDESIEDYETTDEVDDYEYDTEELTEAEQEELDEQEIYDEKEAMILDFIDENFTVETTVTEFELNQNYGTDKEDDYIALIYLDMPKVLSVKRGYDWIEKYTNYLAAEIGQSDDEISELAIFWTMAGSEKNVAKYTLTRNVDNFNFDSQWQDPNITD